VEWLIEKLTFGLLDPMALLYDHHHKFGNLDDLGTPADGTVGGVDNYYHQAAKSVAERESVSAVKTNMETHGYQADESDKTQTGEDPEPAAKVGE
jgi:hypothetical protein